METNYLKKIEELKRIKNKKNTDFHNSYLRTQERKKEIELLCDTIKDTTMHLALSNIDADDNALVGKKATKLHDLLEKKSKEFQKKHEEIGVVSQRVIDFKTNSNDTVFEFKSTENILYLSEDMIKETLERVKNELVDKILDMKKKIDFVPLTSEDGDKYIESCDMDYLSKIPREELNELLLIYSKQRQRTEIPSKEDEIFNIFHEEIK